MKLDEMRLAVIPGPGLVARFERTVLLVLGDSTGPVAAELVKACRSYESAAERLRTIGSKRGRGSPAFFALVDQGDSVVSFVSGAMKVSIEVEGSTLEFASTDEHGWTEENLRGSLRAVAVGRQELKTESQPLGDLLRGVVSGGSLELTDRMRESTTGPKVAPKPESDDQAVRAAPAPSRPASPASAPAIPDDTLPMRPPKRALSEAEAQKANTPGFGQVAILAPAKSPAGPARRAVAIEGRECAQGHLNDPLAPACRICGGPLLDSVSTGPRPPLGRLVGKGGLNVVLDRDFLIGRRPEQAAEVAAGVFAPLAVPAGESGVSRVHCDLRISLWSVLLTDRNSANGTFVRPAGTPDWIRLAPGHTVQVAPGSGISVGPYELHFEP